jgi:hypothetical protein
MPDDAMFMDAFSFDADDLELNRDDHVTYAQRDRLAAIYQQYHRGIVRTLGLVTGIMVVGLVFVLLIGQTTLAELEQGLPIALALLFVVVALTLVASLVLSDDLRQVHMRVAEGKAKLLLGNYRGTPYYRVRLGRKTFNLMNERQFQCFESGARYRVYYVKYWPDVVLSVERIE